MLKHNGLRAVVTIGGRPIESLSDEERRALARRIHQAFAPVYVAAAQREMEQQSKTATGD